MDVERVETVVIGAGQAGLSVAYHLQRKGRSCVLLESNERIGDQWRRRWDSLRLFTPARFDGLAGMDFPAAPGSFPTKDEMADFLETYAARFALSVRSGSRVESVTRNGDGYVITVGDQSLRADHVVVAMADYQRPRVPDFAGDLAAEVMQLHSSDYRHPEQLHDGGVLIVGAGNSGAEIARELSTRHPVMISGRHTGQLPFRIDGPIGRHLVTLVLRLLFHRVLTTGTPPGRAARPKMISRGGPLIRVRSGDLMEAGVEWLPRTVGVRGGLPLLEDGRSVEVANVIWCTGYHPGFSWLHLPAAEDFEHCHDRGVVRDEPGLYFVGQHFQHSLSSGMIHGVSRDAEFVAETISARLVDRRAPTKRAQTHL